MDPLMVRERFVVNHLMQHPELLAPDLALAAVVWPSEEFASLFADRVPSDLARVYSSKCSTCGVDSNERTIGCRTCQNRHTARRKRRNFEQPRSTTCFSCGCDLDDRTRGCVTCTYRMNSRARRAR